MKCVCNRNFFNSRTHVILTRAVLETCSGRCCGAPAPGAHAHPLFSYGFQSHQLTTQPQVCHHRQTVFCQCGDVPWVPASYPPQDMPVSTWCSYFPATFSWDASCYFRFPATDIRHTAFLFPLTHFPWFQFRVTFSFSSPVITAQLFSSYMTRLMLYLNVSPHLEYLILFPASNVPTLLSWQLCCEIKWHNASDCTSTKSLKSSTEERLKNKDKDRILLDLKCGSISFFTSPLSLVFQESWVGFLFYFIWL